MKIVGISYFDFTTKDKTTIPMCTVYTIQEMEKTNQSVGYRSDKFSMTASRAMEFHDILQLNKEIEVLYNRYGKVAEIRAI